MNYQFLLGRLFRLQNQRYVINDVDTDNGIPMARALTRVNGERISRTFPARHVMLHLACDEGARLG